MKAKNNTRQKAWIINHYAAGELQGTELKYVDREIPILKNGEVLIKTRLLTLDPSNHIWLSKAKDYLPQLQIGEVMRGLIIGVVERSLHDNFRAGDTLFATLGWQEYAVVHGDDLIPAKGAVKFNIAPDIAIDAYASALGVTGWTAYIGMKTIGEVKAGDQVLVSGAAGSTGLLACQIAKAAGAQVIGIAGGAEKCQCLINELGLDDCIDYKNCDDLSAAMGKVFPSGIDVFFDNVGGAMLDAALENMAIKGRIVASGSISQYQKLDNKEALYGIKNIFIITSKRLRMEGFLVLDYLESLDNILEEMTQWVREVN
jgi:NADPH-dependent curcumin reductase CurA